MKSWFVLRVETKNSCRYYNDKLQLQAQPFFHSLEDDTAYLLKKTTDDNPVVMEEWCLLNEQNGWSNMASITQKLYKDKDGIFDCVKQKYI